MSEMSATLQWLDTQLKGISGSQGVYRGAAPPLAATPFITVQFYAAMPDETEVASIRLWSDTTWLVEAWGPDTQYSAVESVAKAMDAALHRASGVVTDGSVLYCVRETPRQAYPLVGNIQWMRQGGVYRIITQES